MDRIGANILDLSKRIISSRTKWIRARILERGEKVKWSRAEKLRIES